MGLKISEAMQWLHPSHEGTATLNGTSSPGKTLCPEVSHMRSMLLRPFRVAYFKASSTAIIVSYFISGPRLKTICRPCAVKGETREMQTTKASMRPISATTLEIVNEMQGARRCTLSQSVKRRIKNEPRLQPSCHGERES